MSDDSRKSPTFFLTKASLFLLAAWSLIVGMSMWLGLHDYDQERLALLASVARTEARKDLAYKEWLSSMGGSLCRGG
jgi:hypothetical protein